MLSVSVVLFVFLLRRVTTAQQVVYNHMPGTDFSKYHTYLLFKR
jgi:hypothetical protein